MKANLFLNGSYTNYTNLIDRNIYTLAADGGIQNALRNGLTPHAIIGDGDSFHNKMCTIPFIHVPDQNYTDFDKALQYLEKQGYTDINVYSFQGDRVDHMLAGLSTILAFPQLNILLYSKKQVVKKLPHISYHTYKIGSLISLIPFPEAKKVVTTGLEWNLKGQDISLGKYISISNRIHEKDISIEYSDGILFMIHFF